MKVPPNLLHQNSSRRLCSSGKPNSSYSNTSGTKLSMVKTQKIHAFVKISFISPTLRNTFPSCPGFIPVFGKRSRMLDFRYGVWYDEYINKLKKFSKPDVNQGRKVRSLLHLPPGAETAEGSSAAMGTLFSRGGGVLLRLFLHRCV